MKKLLVVLLVLCTVGNTGAQVTVRVFEADGVTPFNSTEVMVGSKLSIIISSDSNECWSGGLFIKGDDRARGTLSGRDLDPNTGDWTGSHYQAAGNPAKVTAWKDSGIWGFDFYTAIYSPYSPVGNPAAGNWFIIDYKGKEVGDCNVGFYDYNISWSEPNYYISFTNVPTRDLNQDGVVNFYDFSALALQWYAGGCSDPNWCEGADMDRDGYVDSYDLGLFAQYWLWPVGVVIPESESQQVMSSATSEILSVQGATEVPNMQEPNIDDLVNLLERLWQNSERFREIWSEEDLNKFIDRIKDKQ